MVTASTPLSGLAGLLQCPRCRRAPLRADGERYACRGCGQHYPRIGGIPWLFADPDAVLGEWRNRCSRYVEECRAAAARAGEDLALAGRAATRSRLERLAAGFAEQAQLVTVLLAPLGPLVTGTPLAAATQQAFATRLPLTQDLHSYYVNVHRDWAWGEEENARSLELVAGALGARRERLLVLGAGACRLAYDLHVAQAAATTVALDINPLLLLAAQRLLRGEPVVLYEFPIAPRAAGDVALRRELRAPAAAAPGLELVFADAWRAPFAPQSFDAVLTPWLVDIVELDFEAIAAHVNRLLAPGGRWVNFGSLAFPWRRPALQHGRDEALAIVAENGFAVRAVEEATLPYMRSPASRHARLETVVVFAADKARRAPREPGVPAPPPWLADPRSPVPRSAALALAADAARIQAVLLALVDGQRSLDDLVRIVVEQGLLPADAAASAVRGLLERMHAAGERAAG